MPEDSPPGPKDELLQIRLDSVLAEEVKKKAQRFGGASAVVRALLRRWVEEDIVSAQDILAEVAKSGKVGPRPLGGRAPREDSPPRK